MANIVPSWDAMSMRQLTVVSSIFASERVENFQRHYRVVNALGAVLGIASFLLYHGEVIPSGYRAYAGFVQGICLLLLMGETFGVYVVGRNMRHAFRVTMVDSFGILCGLALLLLLVALLPEVSGVLDGRQAGQALILWVQGGVVFFATQRFLRLFNLLTRLARNPLQVFMASFVGLILLGAALLMLPGATVKEGSPPFIDALFMATSATCVTGLGTMNMSDFKPFGQVVILALVQCGGLGIMTFAAFFSIMFGSGGGVRDSAALGEMMSVSLVGRVGSVAGWVLGITLGTEALGAALLYGHWKGPDGYLPVDQQLYYSVFHSISAFCNAGFGLHDDNFVRYVGDWPLILSLGSLIIVGGIGFPVLVDLLSFRFWALPAIRKLPVFRNYVQKQAVPRLSVQTKMVLLTSALLILVGALSFFLMERDHSLAGMSLSDQCAASLFHAITPRTAGFNTVDVSGMSQPTHFSTIILMLIGGSPGSTAGGIKTTTFVVMLLAVVALLRGRSPEIFKRRISEDQITKSLVMLVLAFAFISVAAFTLMLTERSIISERDGALRLLFEAVSAFCTVGLTIGTTAKLTDVGKLIIIGCMFVGRIGPLTLVLAIGARKAQRFAYPTEQVMIG